MGTEVLRGALLSTLLTVTLIAPAISILFTGPASALNPNGWGISYYANNNGSDSCMARAIISSTTPYEHIVLIVVDGVRPDVLVEADTPNIDNLTASGSFTWNAWTVTPSVTIAAVPSIFTGATPEVHGVTDWEGEIYAETIVEVFEEAGLPCAIVGEDAILGGYSATYCTGYYYHPEADEDFTSTAIEWFIEYQPSFLALYNPMPDRRGHAYGHENAEYREAIENADYHIGRLVENLKELGVYESTLIVITTDHGMTGTSHSGGYENDMRVFSVWRGPRVKENYQMVDKVYIPPSATYDETYVAHRIIDIAPTITALATLRAPENSEGNIICQIFDDIIPPDPILIDGNENFTLTNGVTSGTGTENDPYIIEGWDISAENAHGIEIRNTTAHFIVRNCRVENGVYDHHGIYLYNVMNGRVENNICENNSHGIDLNGSFNNIVSNNTCRNNYYGIHLYRVDNNIFDNNTCENNDYGIWFSDSDNNVITNNIIEKNIILGIQLYNISSNNYVCHNTIEKNNLGIRLIDESNNNQIYYNNIINNSTQASDYGSNYWDNGYPSGGNYWSDYSGVDENRGENQDQPGSDGIGDTPYYITGDNNRDRYPLVWTGTAVFSLLNLYTVNVEKNLDLNQGSKLVVKFYSYADAFENENVIETLTPPAHVEEMESARHPTKCVKKAVLVLTYENTENVISTLASFIVRKIHLEMRFIEIPIEWALTPPDNRIIVEQEFMDLPSQWAIAPP